MQTWLATAENLHRPITRADDPITRTLYSRRHAALSRTSFSGTDCLRGAPGAHTRSLAAAAMERRLSALDAD